MGRIPPVSTAISSALGSQYFEILSYSCLTFPQIYSDNAIGRSASSPKFSVHSPEFETSISSPSERPTP